MFRVLLALPLFLITACSQVGVGEGSGNLATAFSREAESSQMAEPVDVVRGAYTIKTGNLRIEVKDLDHAAERAREIVEQSGGFTESTSRYEEGASLSLRIPRDQFSATAERLSEIGKVLTSTISERDVTEEYVDLEARIANLTALRDRLRALLEQAKDVEDIVAVEAQLSNVQIELDQLQGRIKNLQNRITLSTLELHMEQAHVPGPLGLLVHGVAWFVKKLFVLY